MRLSLLIVSFIALTGCGLFSKSSTAPTATVPDMPADEERHDAGPEDVEPEPAVDTGNADQEE